MGVNAEGKSRLERNRQNRRRAIKVMGLLTVAVFVFMVSFVIVYGKTILSKSTIYEGVNINGDDLGGLSKEEAIDLLKDRHDDKLKNKELLMTYEDYSKEVKYEQIGIDYDYSEKVEKAYSIGREGTQFERVVDVISARRFGKSFEFEKKFEEGLVDALVSEVVGELASPAQDASIRHENGKFEVTPETIGLEVEAEELKQNIISSIGERDSFEIPVKVDEPEIRASMLNEIQRLVASYQTSFPASQTNRNYNIKLSAESIDGKVIMPGEVFSFNESTGPRSTSNGYRVSTVIMDGEFVPGVGGGVCQTSTTLYNAIIGAQLEVVERHPHSEPIGYAPTGRDATVAYNVLDLRFKNNFEYPIFIKSEVGPSTVKVEIYGK